jgi:AcrR family transcriptional regulator
LLRLSTEDRKDFIANVASRVFSKKGYQTASLQDVALEAEFSKAGIYHYFKSKADILAYILLRNSDIFLDKLKQSITENQKKALSPLDSFKRLMIVYAYHINNDNDKRQLVLRERHQLSGRHKKELYKKEQAIFRLLRSELQKITDLDEKINLNVVSFQLISMSHWLGYWYKEEKGLNLYEIISQNINIILRGILKHPQTLTLDSEKEIDSFLAIPEITRKNV